METFRFNNATDVINFIGNLELRLDRGEEISLDEIKNLNKAINEFMENHSLEVKSNSGIEYGIKTKFQKLKQRVMKYYSENVTKWDVFVSDMHELEGIEDIIKFIDFIDDRKNLTISNEEINKIDEEYKKLVPSIHKNLSNFESERAIKEIGKKIKLFKNRLSRIIDNDFGVWIKQLRKAKGYSLKDLEHFSGVTASYIHRLESGNRKTPSIPVAEGLALALGVDSDEFFRKLNVLSPEVSTKKSDLSLKELIAINKFTINDKEVTVEQKNSLIDIIESIIEIDMTSENKFTESLKLMEKIESFKISIKKS